MSVSLVIIPLAIAVIAVAEQAGQSRQSIKEKVVEAQKTRTPCVIGTKYTNQELLCKTLQEHGLDVVAVDQNTVRSSCKDSTLVFSRNTTSEPFALTINSAEEVNALSSELSELDEEYGMNVQSYTYNHVKDNLEEGMSVASEEVLEDNSILLTINLE